MPHVSERQPAGDNDDIRPRERAEAPARDPRGELNGEPINPDETAPREQVPDPSDRGAPGTRHPEAVEGEPGSDL